MDTKIAYMPTFRSRQQENLVLSSFDFDESMYPMIEIVKEHDRKRMEGKQLTFREIYLGLIDSIKANRVFVDLPLDLKESGSMKDEILKFSRGVIRHFDIRTEYLIQLADLNEKIIPIVSSYIKKTGEANTIKPQVDILRSAYRNIGFRLFYSTFLEDWSEVESITEENDYIILDLDTIPPYPTSPVLRKIVDKFRYFEKCTKIVLRSAINSDIQNVTLSHDDVVYEADNSLLETYDRFFASAFGDYCGIKKDNLTAGGTISPGFIYYDAVENQYYGYTGNVKKLEEFETTIVPSVLGSQATKRMLDSGMLFLNESNWGWDSIQKIQNNEESGKSQAKFKRIAMEHYLHCIKTKIVHDSQ